MLGFRDLYYLYWGSWAVESYQLPIITMDGYNRMERFETIPSYNRRYASRTIFLNKVINVGI